HQNILRRYVSMDDVERLAPIASRLVSGVKAMKYAADDRRGDVERKAFTLALARSQNARQRFALHVLHHQKKLALERDDVERLYDIRMTDARCEPRFVEEHRDELRFLRNVWVQALDGHCPRKTHFSEQSAVMHGGHAAGSDLVVDRVASQD